MLMSSAYMFGEGGSNSKSNTRSVLSNGALARKSMEDATKSKSGLWGPSHSFATDDTSLPEETLVLQQQESTNSTKQQHASTSKGTHTTKSDTASSADSPTQRATPIPLVQTMTLERIFESASAAVDSLVKTATGSAKKNQTMTAQPATLPADGTDNSSGIALETPTSSRSKTFSAFELFVEETCTSPCAPRHRSESPPRQTMAALDEEESQLGIIPLVSPARSIIIPVNNRVLSEMSVDSPVDRRKKRHAQRLLELPISSFTVHQTLERSISELTMKSSYGEATSKLAENRRMAYYAVGKHHKNSGRGGNRRCYFTGKLILGGAPFYAGSVQQGLRTLVVFCLPSAIGLPKEGVDHLFAKQRSDLTDGRGSNASSQGVLPLPRAVSLAAMALSRVPTKGSTSISRGTSLDDMSFLEEELDPNWDVDRDYLLQVLQEPSKDLLDEMAVRYPDQFETLPVQVRSPHCWRLFIKFCFFSGLPIAEGELHYKVIDDIANEVYGEEIILSHEVMEAVNGESAEIWRLPNLKTFKYLRKHYTQQSGKLADAVFRRTSWEMVRPEI